ncbi:Maf family protein [Marinospirillum alkaliphilum]|uniref:7-methyl-GTP pyrophosphatase n=1 Tax=Marinospirillum alkaliphilum DSM 21637 TaxID=1122209 RepID=A0A1K1X700_9GAMM|nr:Maf family protein [Marinospirillum alkaliphilum]SFX45400.1 MAF protein [Marinospirillum alkaliphilum DSM 21637]
MQTLVLASGSKYRRELLQKLGLAFVTASPDVDETPLAGEQPEALAARLAESKARALTAAFPDSLIIGSDQVCCYNNQILGKSGNREMAIKQLTLLNGHQVDFMTGLCLLNTRSGQAQILVDRFRVHFRELTPDQIHYYVDTEQPFDCAGSFKSEGLGITLFKKLEGDDPNSLIGLPLIRLSELLRAEGLDVLAPQQHS